jgi:hypothetical protein
MAAMLITACKWSGVAHMMVSIPIDYHDVPVDPHSQRAHVNPDAKRAAFKYPEIIAAASLISSQSSTARERTADSGLDRLGECP